MQFIHIAKTKSQWVKTKVVAFMGKIVCKKYAKAVWNPVRMHEQQVIKPAIRHPIFESKFAALEAQLGVYSQSKEGDVEKNKGETLIKPAWGGTEGILW